MTEAALAKADQEKALRIFRAFDIECEVVDEDFQLLVDNHPTIKAYLAGDITLSQAMFVEAYLSNGFNATIKALIARRIAERAMEADEVLARIRDVAEADMGDMVSLHAKEGTDGEIREMVFADPVKAFKEGKFRHVKEYRVDKDGVIHFKLRDQDHALDQLARAAGAFEKDHAQQLPSHVVALLKLDNQELSSRDDVYEEMEDWEPDGVLESGKRETNEPDPEEPEAG
jgi:hypothetical protein